MVLLGLGANKIKGNAKGEGGKALWATTILIIKHWKISDIEDVLIFTIKYIP